MIVTWLWTTEKKIDTRGNWQYPHWCAPVVQTQSVGWWKIFERGPSSLAAADFASKVSVLEVHAQLSENTREANISFGFLTPPADDRFMCFNLVNKRSRASTTFPNSTSRTLRSPLSLSISHESCLEIVSFHSLQRHWEAMKTTTTGRRRHVKLRVPRFTNARSVRARVVSFNRKR